MWIVPNQFEWRKTKHIFFKIFLSFKSAFSYTLARSCRESPTRRTIASKIVHILQCAHQHTMISNRMWQSLWSSRFLFHWKKCSLVYCDKERIIRNPCIMQTSTKKNSSRSKYITSFLILGLTFNDIDIIWLTYFHKESFKEFDASKISVQLSKCSFIFCILS